MVQLLTGTKGTGKTKRLIAKANAAVEATKGYVAVVAIGLDLRYDISAQARLINVKEYYVKGEDMLLGFLGGICAGNYDTTDIFVDTTLKILDTKDPELIKRFIRKVEKLSQQTNTNFVLSVSIENAAIADVADEYIRIVED